MVNSGKETARGGRGEGYADNTTCELVIYQPETDVYLWFSYYWIRLWWSCRMPHLLVVASLIGGRH